VRCKHGHALESFLADPGNLNISPFLQDGTALVLASQEGHVEASQLLLESKADVNAADKVHASRMVTVHVWDDSVRHSAGIPV
jgi:ankyrin repeat protein